MHTWTEFSWKKRKLKKPVLIVGLPGIGLVGKIAVDYTAKQLKAKKIADIYSESFPPSVYVEKGKIDLIKDELLLYSHKNQDFLFLVGPVQPALDARFSTLQEHYEFANTLTKICKSLGIKEIYTIAGINIGDARLHRNPQIIAAATDDKILESLKKMGAKSQMKNGLISGIAGLLLGVSAKKGIKGACLMGETSDKLVYGDHRASKKLIEVLVKKYDFKISMDAIEKEAKNIDKAFKQIATEIAAKKTDSKESDSPSYVR